MKLIQQERLLDNLSELFKQVNIDFGDKDIDLALQKAVYDAVELSQLQSSIPTIEHTSILISDLRGFTVLLEKHPAIIVVEILNHYFKKMIEIIHRHGGNVDKLMGDSIMALFTVKEEKNGLSRILSCAIEMQSAMDEINQFNQARGVESLYMGIGIDTGQVVKAILGSDIYHESTVIGHHVNLASRIETYSLHGQILLSENTYALAKNYIDISNTNTVSVKGVRNAITIYELNAVTFPKYLQLPVREHRRGLRIPIRIRMEFQVLTGKEVLPEVNPGLAINIGYGGISIFSQRALDTATEIKISLPLSLFNEDTSEIYARVMSCKTVETGYELGVEFTTINDAASGAIKSYIDSLI